jgi:5-methylcytosine-specific restriction endonuclease McrA
MSGENCHFWKGGITPENIKIRMGIEFRLWRESVFARDNYTCQKCSQKGGKLNPHHIFNFSTYLDLRFAIDNGITLCKECHREFHKKYGYRNNTREQLEKFFQLN